MTQVHGVAQMAVSGQTGQTRLTQLYQHEPLRVLFPEARVGFRSFANSNIIDNNAEVVGLRSSV